MRKLTGILTVLAVVPLAALAGPVVALGRQTYLVQRHECRELPCAHDVDGDGRADRISVAPRPTLNGASQGDLEVRVGARAFRLAPYNRVDESWKTHVAVVPRSAGPPRVVVWDGTDERGLRPVNAAWEWRGRALAPVPHSHHDAEVARAMASYDDTGGFWWRLAVEATATLLLPAWWVLLLIIAAAMRSRARRVEAPA